jgi:hypothetical protein
MEDKLSRFLFCKEDFKFLNKKISINKLELSKVMNVSIKSGKPGYTFIPQPYKEDREFEDEVVNDINEWIKNAQQSLESEIKELYDL